MLSLQLSDVALWTRGSVHGANVGVHGVFADTRAPVAGGLFVALRGENFDAHDFVATAKRVGAAAALVARPVDVDIPHVVVMDTTMALGDLASAIRAQRRARVIGITGSNGKTTVKTLLASILALHGKTHVNAGNLNNEIGLPMSLLSLPTDAEFAVLEMGAGKHGDIAYLAAIARPEIGLANNIAPAHLERMGSLEGIAETKGALYTTLPAQGVAVINTDDAFATFFTNLAGTRRVIRFGVRGDADVRAENIRLGTETRFELVVRKEHVEIALPLNGRHNVQNAIAAAACAIALDVSIELIKRGLESAPSVKGRLQRYAMPGGWTLIDDSYNANPGSTAAAIATLVSEPGEAWLVLGDMRELGADAHALHAATGKLAHDSGIAKLYTVGDLSAAAAKAFGAKAQHFDSQRSLAATLAADVKPGVRVLVKGSRGSAMERVVHALRGEGETAGGARDAA
ncbi:MAG TPA: UDP-N-acetylmuramoyl-tripeptide--D-alanyl-D-alanine ligase [Rudaea sp.]|jgi:UDP-N-acetylmuramoyl-tripeptide--D-alanyl-D-alanine ligase|nr:UDP-N-acetylmuramoyl-tripeptide--D-alanyl-D-alanine ligase [Rudaea sp.]